WFPRGLLLRVAARQACQQMIQEWQHHEFAGSPTDVEAACARALSDPGLSWEALSQQIERAAYSSDGTPAEILGRLLNELNEDSNRPEIQNNIGFWAQHAVSQVEEWVGARVNDSKA
ncbi:MAG: hypothetical protein ACJ8F7_17430, partial [Gemmataceae bacterium]